MRLRKSEMSIVASWNFDFTHTLISFKSGLDDVLWLCYMRLHTMAASSADSFVWQYNRHFYTLSVESQLQGKRLRWLGHVFRMPNDRLTKKLFVW